MIKTFCDKCEEEICGEEYWNINLDMESDLYYLLCNDCWIVVKVFIEGNHIIAT